jgi:hypothetical protein
MVNKAMGSFGGVAHQTQSVQQPPAQA